MRLKFMLFTCMLAGALSTLAAPLAPHRFISVDTPGSQFRPTVKAKVINLADGLSVRGEAYSQVTLSGVISRPKSELAEPRAARLTIHFRTSRNGPTLRRIILSNGRAFNLYLQGDFLADSKRNTVEFGEIPLKVFDDTTIQLEVSFPGGIDSVIDPGEFFLQGITIDYLKKPPSLAKVLATPVRSKQP